MNFDIKGIMSKVQEMQSEMKRVKEELDQKSAFGEAGGGMVKVEMTGNHTVKAIKITKEIINPDDPELLEDLLVAAVNNAVRNVDEMVSSEMGRVNSMMPNIPGLNMGM